MNTGRAARLASMTALIAFLGIAISPIYLLTYGAPHLLACGLLFWVCDRAAAARAEPARRSLLMWAAGLRLAMVMHTCWVALDLRFGHGLRAESTLLLTGSLVLAAIHAQPSRVGYLIGLAPPLMSMLLIVVMRPLSDARTGLATLLMLATVLMAAVRQQKLARRALTLQARSDASARSLADSLAAADLAAEVASLGHWRLGPGEEHVWSPGVFRIFGLPVAEAPPPVPDAIACYREEERADLAVVVARAQEERSGFNFEHHLIRADGCERTILAKARYLESDNGGFLLGVVQDVTEQRAAERLRSESEARYRLLADNAGDMIVQCKLTGAITYISPACIAITGYAPEELIGRRITDLMLEEDVAEAEEALRYALTTATDDPWRVEYRVRHKNGDVIWLECHPRLAFDDVGAAIGIVDVVRDATVRKAMEADLVAAREAAEAGGQVKTDFLANMSHELRTPLNSIVGFSSLIAEAPELASETRRRARMVHEASRSLVSIVNDVLEVSRIDAEGVTLRPEPTDIGHVMHSVVELARPEAEGKGVALVVQLPTAPTRVLVDGVRLRQVLMNLVGNAVKFTDRGAVCVSVSHDAQDRLRFEVKDSGVGIPLDRQAAIFQRFAQVDGSTARRFGGSGLGLTICRSIVDAMEGEIGVHSVEGAGSTFWFVIAPPQAKEARDPQQPSAEVTDMRGVRLLLADDNPMNRDLFAALLEHTGVEITFAEDGAQALAAVKAQTFDIVFMDVQMPVMDGFETTRAIRAEGFHRLPIIALTANVLQPQVDQCLATGMNAHLGKPFRLKDVLTTLAQWVDRPPVTANGGVQVDIMESLARAIGAQKLAHFLAGLADNLRDVAELMARPDADATELARQAHQVCGYAASLGYMGVGDSFRDLERACHDGGDIGPALAAARAATRAALYDLDERRAA